MSSMWFPSSSSSSSTKRSSGAGKRTTSSGTANTASTTSATSNASSNHNMDDASSQRFNFTPEEEEAFVNLTFKADQFICKRDISKADFKDHYALGNLVGTGGFGKVYSCIHMATRLERAAKIVPKSDKKKDNKVVKKEFELLTQLDHPNLVKAYEFFEDDDAFYIITDYYEGRDLFELIQREGPLPESDVAAIMKRLLCCVNYCHANNIVHRDLKLENVLLSAGNDAEDYDNLKLIDFGLAKQQKPDKPFYDVAGSCAYISPQMIQGEYNGGGCDIWALGVICYVLLCGELPFAAPTDKEVVQRIESGDIRFDHDVFKGSSNNKSNKGNTGKKNGSTTTSPECVQFISDLLTYEESYRPSAQEALQHPWLQKYHHKLQRQQQHATINGEEAELLLDKEIKSALRSMRRFESRQLCKLKQATGALIASQFLRPIQRRRIDAVFRVLDRSCQGYLTMDDLQWAFGHYLELHGTTEDLHELIRPMISDDVVKYSEFAAIFALEGRKTEWQSHAQQLVHAVYNHLDIGDKGYVSAHDLQTQLALKELSSYPESTSRIMIAEVTNSQVINKTTFERAILGRKRASNNPYLLKSLAKQVDQCQAHAEALTRDMGKFMHTLMGK